MRRPPTMTTPLARRRLLVGAALSALGGAGRAAGEAPPIVERVDIGRSQIEVQFAPGFDAGLRSLALAWVRRSAAAVAAYFGHFPLPRVELLLLPADGAGVRGGSTYGEPEPWMRVRVGRATGEAQFRDDWVLVHEMVHLAVPRVPRAHGWLHEGIATYVEGVARAQAGLVAAATVWREWQQAMPQGLPQAGDRGLDHTPTWGRTYWGGAMFCLLADVRLLQASGLRHGLRQALQGVLAAGGSYAAVWSAPRILEVADAAVGQHTLVALYDAMKDQPHPVDLPALWRELGVAGDSVLDDAPAAAVRRAILS